MQVVRADWAVGGGGRPPLRRARAGYTLLEVILALVIAVMLFSALYVIVQYQLNHAQAGREVIEQATLARSVLNKMGNDIQASMNLCDAARFRRSQSGSGQGGMTGGGTGAGAAGGSGTTGA